MTLDYILWLTVHKDSSAHKWKKKQGFLIQKRVEHFFHTQTTLPLAVASRTPAPCCQYTSPIEPRPSHLHSPNYPMSYPENLWLGALLSNAGAQTTKGKWGGEKRQKVDLDGPLWTKCSFAKPEFLYVQAKYPPWVSTLPIRCMHSNDLQHQRLITPSLLQKHCIQLRPTQWEC